MRVGKEVVILYSCHGPHKKAARKVTKAILIQESWPNGDSAHS